MSNTTRCQYKCAKCNTVFNADVIGASRICIWGYCAGVAYYSGNNELDTSTKRAMKTSTRSPERLELINKLYEASKAMAEASVIWSKLNTEEFFAAGLCYPSYLPSFDEFVTDIDFWLDHMCNEDYRS